MKFLRLIACMIALCVAGSPAAADSITFAGSTIALRNCTIENITKGQVFYRDAQGQAQRRPLEEIQSLGFDGLAALDEAEKAIAAQEYDAGIEALLLALLDAGTDLQKRWVHARLAKMHDVRGQMVQAAGHAAAVFISDDDPSWRSLQPVSPPDQPSFPAAKESLESLLQAKRQVKNAELLASVQRMLDVIQPLHDRLLKEYTGPPIASGSTISGVPKDQIRKQSPVKPQETKTSDTNNAASRPAQEIETVPPARTKPDKPAAKPPATAPTRVPTPVPSPPSKPPATAPAHNGGSDSPSHIESLLAASRATEALTCCERVAKKPGNRDVSQFLHQYGRALAGTGQPRTAAVMFMRCAILYPDSEHAAKSMIEAAVIHRDVYGNPQAARRLLEAAARKADEQSQRSVAMLARETLSTLPATAPTQP